MLKLKLAIKNIKLEYSGYKNTNVDLGLARNWALKFYNLYLFMSA